MSAFNDSSPEGGLVCFGGSAVQGIELQDQDWEELEVTAGSLLAARCDAGGGGAAKPSVARRPVGVTSLGDWLRGGEDCGETVGSSRAFRTWTLSVLESEPGTVNVRNHQHHGERTTVSPTCILRLTEHGIVLPREEAVEPAEGELLLGELP